MSIGDDPDKLVGSLANDIHDLGLSREDLPHSVLVSHRHLTAEQQASRVMRLVPLTFGTWNGHAVAPCIHSKQPDYDSRMARLARGSYTVSAVSSWCRDDSESISFRAANCCWYSL